MIRQRKPIRRTPLKRSKGPDRFSPTGGIKKRNPRRIARKRVRNFTGGIAHDTRIRSMPCCLCYPGEQKTPTQAAHAKARGMGGAGGTWRSLAPLCHDHHREQERIGNAGIFAVYAISLDALAERLADEHEAELKQIT